MIAGRSGAEGVHGAGQMAAGPFVVLAHVDHGDVVAVEDALGEVAHGAARHAAHNPALGHPVAGVDPATQVAETDAVELTGRLVSGARRPGDEHQGGVDVDNPAHPCGEGAVGRYAERVGHVGSVEFCVGAAVDGDRPGVQRLLELGGRQPARLHRGGGAGEAIERRHPGVVGGVPALLGVDRQEVREIRGRGQRVVAPLGADRGHPLVRHGGAAERATAVGGKHAQVVRQGQQPVAQRVASTPRL